MLYPPRHQSPKEHGDEEAEGVAGHDEGAGGAAEVGVRDLRHEDGGGDQVAARAVPGGKPIQSESCFHKLERRTCR